MKASATLLLAATIAWLAVCGPLCCSAADNHRKAKTFSSKAVAVKPTCGHPSLQRCLAAAKANAKAYTAQTCGAVLKGGAKRKCKRRQQQTDPADDDGAAGPARWKGGAKRKRRQQATKSADDDGAADPARWRRELEELVSALGNKSKEAVTNDDINMQRASGLRNYPQRLPNSTLAEQMALVRSVLAKGEANNITCADFTQFYDTVVQVAVYGVGNLAVAIGRLLGMGAALALGSSNGQSIGDTAGSGIGSVVGSLVFRNYLNRVGVPPGARARGRRVQLDDTVNYMGVNGLSYSAGAGIGLGTGYAIGVPAGVAAGRQRGTEIGVAFTRWLAETSNFIIRYAMALFLANTQESLGKVGTALDPQIDEVEQWMLDTWAADNARLEAGNFTSYELEMITGWRKTGAIGGFVAGQAIGPAIGETSGAIWGSVGSAMATAAVNGLRTYLDASNTTSSSSLPLPAASRRLLQSLLDDALTTEALEALIQGLFDFDEGGGDEGASQKEDAGPTEQRREDKPKRKAQSLAARVGMSPAAIAGWGVFAGEVTNTAPLMANAIAGWAATSIVIGASAGIGAGVANGVAWGIGREIGHGGSVFFVDFIDSVLTSAQGTLQPYIGSLNLFWWITYGIDPEFDFVPGCNFSTYNYTQRDVGYYDHSKWDKPSTNGKTAGNATAAEAEVAVSSSPSLSYDEYDVPWFGNFTTKDVDGWAAANATAEIADVVASGSATSPAEQQRQVEELEAYAAQILEAKAKAQREGFFAWTAADFSGVSADRKRNFKQCKSYAQSEMYARINLCYMDC